MLAIGVLISVYTYLVSRRRGALAGKNPWGADTLEWSTESPPIRTRHPLWDDHDEEHDPDAARILDDHRVTLSTTWLDADPASVAQMPEDSLMPITAALVLLAFFIGVLARSLPIIGISAIATGVVAAAFASAHLSSATTARPLRPCWRSARQASSTTSEGIPYSAITDERALRACGVPRR